MMSAAVPRPSDAGSVGGGSCVGLEMATACSTIIVLSTAMLRSPGGIGGSAGDSAGRSATRQGRAPAAASTLLRGYRNGSSRAVGRSGEEAELNAVAEHDEWPDLP
jgi:hypothetical protein